MFPCFSCEKTGYLIVVGHLTIENQIKEDDTTICAGLTVAAFLYTHSVVRNPLPGHQTQWI